MLVKVLYNIDGLNVETANEMKYISRHLNGYPVIIGDKTRDHPLESGVVYFRYNIPAINIDTLKDYFIDGMPPLIYAEHGGLYVNIDGSALREERNKKNISLGALASLVGVSRRTISKYEEGEMAASVEVALKLEEILDRGFTMAVNLFEEVHIEERKKQEPDKLSLSIFSRLEDIGFNVIPTSQAPFDAVSITSNRNENSTILTGVSGYASSMVKKAHLMSSISEVTLTQSLLIVNGVSKRKNIEKTVLLEKNELKKLHDTEDFMNLLEDRRRN